MLVEKKKGEEKGREEKLELGAEGKKRGRRLRGRGSARVSARQRIVRVLHLHCAQMFANVNSQWMLYIVQRTTYNMFAVRPANGGLLLPGVATQPWGGIAMMSSVQLQGFILISFPLSLQIMIILERGNHIWL